MPASPGFLASSFDMRAADSCACGVAIHSYIRSQTDFCETQDTGTGVQQRINDGVFRPLIELLHEARFLLFGHVFVNFGKFECFGSGQLALLATA